ncbi:MAG TPA: 3-dehydroquinate synthase family protein [Bacteroidales bacterium]|nr:3-dehydroquinate synthase family protein [Bacteroidales bacterium]
MKLTFGFRATVCEIIEGKGSIAHVGNLVGKARNVLVITDSGVPLQYAESVLAQFYNASLLIIPQGEESKNFNTLELIIDTLRKREIDRYGALIAVGGGMTCDITGFAASCYNRDIDYYNVPTTLLAQVDASIGGKTALNFGGIKNLVGAFHHPKGVVIDTDTLKTLDKREFYSGLAEVIKMAATSDAALFSLLESDLPLNEILDDIVGAALQIKCDVVLEDPLEHGLRKVLNFGHTIGHAIEIASNGRLLHGESIAAGMTYFCSDEMRKRLERLLKRYYLPVKSPFSGEVLLPYIALDKKRTEGLITTVFVESPGIFDFRKMTPEEVVALI